MQLADPSADHARNLGGVADVRCTGGRHAEARGRQARGIATSEPNRAHRFLAQADDTGRVTSVVSNLVVHARSGEQAADALAVQRLREQRRRCFGAGRLVERGRLGQRLGQPGLHEVEVRTEKNRVVGAGTPRDLRAVHETAFCAVQPSHRQQREVGAQLIRRACGLLNRRERAREQVLASVELLAPCGEPAGHDVVQLGRRVGTPMRPQQAVPAFGLARGLHGLA